MVSSILPGLPIIQVGLVGNELSSGEGFGADGSGRFAYRDTQAALGMIFEVIEPPTGLGEPLRRL